MKEIVKVLEEHLRQKVTWHEWRWCGHKEKMPRVIVHVEGLLSSHTP